MGHIDLGRTRITKMRKEKTTENDEEGLNGLPDDLLLEILSLLPLKSAIATAVLSRRWRWLWTNLFDIDMDIDYVVLLPLLNNILPKLTSPYIRCLGLNLRISNSDVNEYIRRCCAIPSEDYDYLTRNTGLWFDWAACRNKKHIRRFRYIIDYEVVSPDIPVWVFQLPCLVELELKPLFVLPHDYEDTLFNLPNLKKVCVDLPWGDYRLLEKLVSSSPLLEDLYFNIDTRADWGNNDCNFVNLSRRTSLKRLEMHLNIPIQVVIDAPNLDYLSIHTSTVPNPSSYKISFINPPTALLSCSISASTEDLVDDAFLPSNLFSVIFSVKFFTAVDQNPSPLIAPITFTSLTHLQFKVHTALGGLPLLHQCPVLEVLTFDLHEHVIDLNVSWSLPDSTPQCLVTRVKRIEILAHPYIRRLEFILLDLLSYLFDNAKALELLRITVTPRPDLNKYCSKWYDEERLIKKVFEVPRSSPLSRVEFFSPNRKVVAGGGMKSVPSSHLLHE